MTFNDFTFMGSSVNRGGEAPGMAPDVYILLPAPIQRQRTYVVTFKWSQAIDNFQLTDIDSTNMVISNLNGLGDTWSADITLAANTASQASITVNKETVTGTDNVLGPPDDRTVLFNFDTTEISIPSGMCSREFDFTSSAFPYRLAGDTGGSYESVLECKVLGNYMYIVYQIGRYTQEIDYGPERDANPLFVAKAITGEVQAGAALVRCNLTNCTWQTLRLYRQVSAAARSLFVMNNRMHFFEGGSQAYYNEGDFHQLSNPGDFNTVVIDNDAERIDGAFPTGPFGMSFPVKWRLSNDQKSLEIRLNREEPDYQSQRQNIRTGRIFLIDRIRLLITNVSRSELDTTTVFTIQFINLDNAAFPAVEQGSTIQVSTSDYETVFSTSRLRGTDGWKSRVGYLNQIDPVSGAISNLGLNWKSSDIQNNPNSGKKPPYTVESGMLPVDRFYGIHGGTISPIIYDGEKVNLITGYGNLQDIDKNDAEVSRIDNWQWIQYHNNLNRKIVKLETNDKTLLEILQDILLMTNSIMYLDGDEFIIKPRLPIQEIDPQTAMPTPIAEDHTLKIDKQTSVQAIKDIDVQANIDQLFNKITINYGDGKTHSVTDPDSITKYNRIKELDLHVELDASQIVWVRWLADRLLSHYKDLKEIITLQLQPTLYMKLGDIVMLECTERDRINKLCQLINIEHRFTKVQGRSFRLITICKFISL